MAVEGLPFLSSPFPPGLMDQVHGSCVVWCVCGGVCVVVCVCVCVCVCVLAQGSQGELAFLIGSGLHKGKDSSIWPGVDQKEGWVKAKEPPYLPKREAGSLILLATELGLGVSIYAVRVNLETAITSHLEFNCFLRYLPTAIATTMLEEGLPKPSPALVPFLIRHFWWLLMSAGKSPILACSPIPLTPPFSPTSATSPQAVSSELKHPCFLGTVPSGH